MFELKISTDAAVTLITERMKQEYNSRIKCGLLHEDYDLNVLPYSILLDIAETATMDLIFLLPVYVLMEKIICRILLLELSAAFPKYSDVKSFLTTHLPRQKNCFQKQTTILGLIPKVIFSNQINCLL